MKKNRLWIYLGFFALLLGGFFLAIYKEHPFTDAPLAVINPLIPEFKFTDQNGKSITQKTTEDKVYVAEYFFTTCRGICPKMNANMRRVFDAFKTEKDFLILSHTCMPEVDSIPLLKAYEQKMIGGTLLRNEDGSYKVSSQATIDTASISNLNWHFLTGDKAELYKLARQGYQIDNGKPDSTQRMEDQFIHTQFFALVDRYGRVRGIYDGLIEADIQKLLKDIPSLLKEKVDHNRFMNGFSNNPG
ncbi:MAG: SCO family protein [Sphingobacteriales bacterium]|jgi:protein SCO1|nr:SCO family protein [Sphingobacteriales bacterium]